MSYYSEIDDIRSLEDEVGATRSISSDEKTKPVSICIGCPKESECAFNNGVRQGCDYKSTFIANSV